MMRETLNRWLGLASTMLVLLALSSTALAQPEDKVRLLVGLKQGPGLPVQAQADLAASVGKLGGNVRYTYSIVPAMAIEVPPNAVANLLAHPAVNLIEVDGEVQANAEEVPWGVDKIKALKNPTTGETEYTGGAGIVVAVLDSGIDLDHPDLMGNLYVNPLEAAGVEGVDDDGNGYVDDIQGWNFVRGNNFPDDDNGHGSHCAGSIGAMGNNGQGVVGVAPSVTLLPLKVLNRRGSGSFSDIIAAVEYCVDNGVHITSNSYGSSGDPGAIVKAAFDAADAAGVLNFAAAGNEGNSAGTGDSVGYPAAYPSVVAVASTDIGDNRSSFSSTGPDVEIAAPGSSILSTYKNGGYATLSGTSMACPHAAGAAAVLMGDGETDIDIVRTTLAVTAVDLGAAGIDPLYGAGRIDVLAARGGVDVTPPGSDPGTVTIDSITYSTSSRGRDLLISIHAIDDLGSPVAGAAVAITLTHEDSGTSYSATGTTGTDGTVTFRLRRASKGTYSTVINNVTAAGLDWDGNTPENGFTL